MPWGILCWPWHFSGRYVGHCVPSCLYVELLFEVLYLSISVLAKGIYLCTMIIVCMCVFVWVGSQIVWCYEEENKKHKKAHMTCLYEWLTRRRHALEAKREWERRVLAQWLTPSPSPWDSKGITREAQRNEQTELWAPLIPTARGARLTHRQTVGEKRKTYSVDRSLGGQRRRRGMSLHVAHAQPSDEGPPRGMPKWKHREGDVH